MNYQTSLVFFIVVLFLQSCGVQKSKNSILKVENHLNGPLDYSLEALELVQKQVNGEEFSLGQITQDGVIQFNLPQFDIKALHDNIPLQPRSFFSHFLINNDCIDRDIFADTPFREAYSQKFNPIFIKKYGEKVAVLFPATGERIFDNNTFYRYNDYDGKELTLGSKYFWFYMDRDIAFTDNCSKKPLRISEIITLDITADIQLKKGWNFIEEKLLATQTYTNGDQSRTIPKSIHFSNSAPSSKNIKWFLIQIMKDKKLQKVKSAYEIAPISREAFKNWIPEKAGNFTRTTYELDKALERSSSIKNNAFAVFENGSQKMEIAVLDGAKNPDDMEMVNFSFAMDEEHKREDKPATDIDQRAAASKGEPHHISKEDATLKTAQVIALFKDRIVLYAKGENLTAAEMWKTIQTLEVGSLLE